MQLRAVGATGLTVSRLGLGTMTWGRDTDEHEARDQLIVVRRGRRHAGRHRGRLRRRSVRGADRLADRRRGRPRRDRDRHQGRHLPPTGDASTYASRGRLLSAPRRLPASARCRPRRPLAGPHLGRRRAARGDPVGARPRRLDRSGVVRRDLQLHRLADRAGGHLAARRAGPGHAGVDPGGVLPAQPAHRAGRRTGGRGPRTRHPAVVAAGPWRADRQVPQRRPVRLPGRVAGASPGSSSPTSTSAASAIVEAVAKAAEGLGWSLARGRARVGARPAGSHRTRSSARARPPSCWAPSAWRS